MTEHELKTWREPFEHMWSGAKTFEIRKDDRKYRVGDVLWLREYDHLDSTYLGRELRVEVTYVLGGGFGIPDGYVCMSVKRMMLSADSAPEHELRVAVEAYAKSWAALEYEDDNALRSGLPRKESAWETLQKILRFAAEDTANLAERYAALSESHTQLLQAKAAVCDAYLAWTVAASYDSGESAEVLRLAKEVLRKLLEKKL